ncbi:MAG: Gfo/Idh/MocA family oxidoreductase, partial [Opitutales bacterium]|nr:Gfo/Idh/MocA family oxidoreductase [Opitutales bacterium]
MKENKHHSRREFLKQLAFAGAGVVAAPSFLGALTEVPDSAKSASGKYAISETRPRPAGAKFVGNLTTEPCETVRIGLIGLGQRGFGFSPQNAGVLAERRGYWGLLGEILNVPFARVVAVADRDFSRAEEAVRICSRIRPNRPAPGIYAGTENAWKSLCAREDVDVVVIATPWNLHVPMALRAMNSGKHVFIEVPAAVSVDECWALTDASELTQRHCVI